jgi:hypothetical protein
MEQFIFKSARDGGGIVPVDKTGNVCMTVRATSSCAPLLVANSPIDGRDWSNTVIANPALWGSLQMLVAGSVNEIYPRSNNKVSTGIGALATWELWLDPSQMSLADGASVTRQTDYSGRGRDAFTYSAAPVYKTNVVNGKPVVRFTAASSQGLAFASIDLTDFTAFVVQKTSGDAQIVSAPKGFAQLVRLGDYGAGLQYLVSEDDGLGSGGGYADVRSSVVSVARTSFSIIEVVRSGTAVSWFENGTAKGTGTLGPGTVAGTRFTQIMKLRP